MNYFQVFGVIFAALLWIINRATKGKAEKLGQHPDGRGSLLQEVDDQSDTDFWDDEDERLVDES